MEDLVTDLPFPNWTKEALLAAAYVVVRRAEYHHGLIPVGIRGVLRGQRLACWLPEAAITAQITPFQLTNKQNWKAEYAEAAPATVSTLENICTIMQDTGYEWGPTGSTGFELATGFPAIKASSDLDLIIEVPEILNVKTAKNLLDRIEDISTVRLDIQLNTAQGGFSLLEYTRSKTVLVKTANGPVLMDASTIWN